MSPPGSRWSGGLSAAVGLVLPGRCGGCGAVGERWCAACRASARRGVVGRPTPGGEGPRCWAATPCEGPVRAAVTAYKDAGRVDLRDPLGGLLALAVRRALTADPVLRRGRTTGRPVLLVPVPATAPAQRRRGGDPVLDLAVAALHRLDEPHARLGPVLRHTRRVADQTRLGRAGRAANLAGALVVAGRHAGAVEGAACVLVDDVVTTGATLAEAARALRAAGAGHVVAAVVAATPGPTRGW